MNSPQLKLILFLFFVFNLNIEAKMPNQPKWFKNAITRSEQQLLLAVDVYKPEKKNPRTFQDGKVTFVAIKDWTCGFFPGSLWYIYELTKNEKFKNEADHYSRLLEGVQYRTNTHDLGFIIYCSYGNGYRITGNPAYRKVMETGAQSLMTRFDENVGLIKSWDNRKNWQYPVIIDNMMNLEFLLELGRITGDKSMKLASISHADNTLKNHFRADNSCYHVVDYDSINGTVLSKETHQGINDSSSWARGQAWALYGYTMMYRETKKPEYLAQAQKVASFILNHPRLPKDKIPYWDFDAPNIPNEPRDASAGALYASALLELSSYVSEKNDFFKTAETILKNLSSDKYLAKKGENGLFLLKHSTGNWPKKDEIDTPLSYADYYYLEAMKRYINIAP
jgi:rhamnogalacturonyl hydrolase YesR